MYRRISLKLTAIFSISFLAGVMLFAGPEIAAQDQPTIAKDWIQVGAFTKTRYKESYDIWSWLPKIAFRVNGPIQSGDQLYVEFSYPGAPSWVKFDCDTGPIQKGYWWKTVCGGADLPESQSSTYFGYVNFAIKMRNELMGTDATLFTGKAKVGKAPSNEFAPKGSSKNVYFIDHDWEMPIGYVFLEGNDALEWQRPPLRVAFWVRGDANHFDPHIFYQGKEVGKVFSEGVEIFKPICDKEIEIEPSQYVADSVPQKARWTRVKCSFFNILGWDKSGQQPGIFGAPFLVGSNPGDYEFKLLWNNKLARSIKFTVGSDGRFDNGIATSNKLGSDRVIVPVTVIGDQDGPWDRNAWKSDAFYGSPLKGFTALP